MSHTTATTNVTDNVNSVVETECKRTDGTTSNGKIRTTIVSSNGEFRFTTSDATTAPFDKSAGLVELTELCDDMIDHWNAVKTKLAAVAPEESSGSSSASA